MIKKKENPVSLVKTDNNKRRNTNVDFFRFMFSVILNVKAPIPKRKNIKFPEDAIKDTDSTFMGWIRKIIAKKSDIFLFKNFVNR